MTFTLIILILSMPAIILSIFTILLHSMICTITCTMFVTLQILTPLLLVLLMPVVMRIITRIIALLTRCIISPLLFLPSILMSSMYPHVTISFRATDMALVEEFRQFLRSQQFKIGDFYQNFMRFTMARFKSGDTYYPCPDGLLRLPQDWFASDLYKSEFCYEHC